MCPKHRRQSWQSAVQTTPFLFDLQILVHSAPFNIEASLTFVSFCFERQQVAKHCYISPFFTFRLLQLPSLLLRWGTPDAEVRVPFTENPEQVQVHCFFTSTETIRTIRNGESWTSTSTFTQLLSSDTRSPPFYFIKRRFTSKDHKDY